MSTWVDFSTYTAVVIVLWFLVPRFSAHFTRDFLEERNSDWTKANPDAVVKFTDSATRSGVWLYHLWGVVSFAVLLSLQLGLVPQHIWPAILRTAPWEPLRIANTVLLIAGLTLSLAMALAARAWFNRHVPLADLRHAQLRLRSLDDFLPRWNRLAVYAVIGLHLGAWTLLGLVGNQPAKIWAVVAFMFALSGIFYLLTLRPVLRPPNALDRIFGPGYRRKEVRMSFAAQLLPLFAGFGIYDRFFSPSELGFNRVWYLVLMAWIVLVALTTLHMPARGPNSEDS